MLSAADNQIVTLSARSPYNILSGCTIQRKTAPIPAAAPTTAEPAYATSPEYGDKENASTETSFDRFLKRTTANPLDDDRTGKALEDNTTADWGFLDGGNGLESFNDTEVFNKSSASDGRNGGGLSFKHDTAFENELENSTEYRSDVEELFESPVDSHHPVEVEGAEDGEERARSKRLVDGNLFYRSRETYTVRCHNAGTFISSRERWWVFFGGLLGFLELYPSYLNGSCFSPRLPRWYIAIANCGSDKGLDVTYRFKMTNGNPGEFWHEHFSADERCKSSQNERKCLKTEENSNLKATDSQFFQFFLPQ